MENQVTKQREIRQDVENIIFSTILGGAQFDEIADRVLRYLDGQGVIIKGDMYDTDFSDVDPLVEE